MDKSFQFRKGLKVTISEPLMRRLTIARYLFQMGIEQSHRGEPFGALAISPLHDAAELFLLVGLEHCEATLPEQKNDFFANWKAIEQRIEKKLSWRPEMDRFNKARVELKHRGLLPDQSAVEEFRHIVESFFEENCPVLFEMDFAEISLSGLVVNELVRTSLQLAEVAIRNSECTRAIEEATKAFHRTLSEYRYGRLAEGTLDRLYEPVADLSSLLSYPFLSSKDASFGMRVSFPDAMERLVNGLGEAIMVVAYNLDYDGYRYLKHFGPVVHELPGGDVIVDWPIRSPITNVEIASRCVAFAINAALRLQSKQAAAA